MLELNSSVGRMSVMNAFLIRAGRRDESPWKNTSSLSCFGENVTNMIKVS